MLVGFSEGLYVPGPYTNTKDISVKFYVCLSQIGHMADRRWGGGLVNPELLFKELVSLGFGLIMNSVNDLDRKWYDDGAVCSLSAVKPEISAG